MWAFRTRPENLTDKQQAELKTLFERVPELEFVYDFRWGLTEVFDKAANREEAAAQLEEFRVLLESDDTELAEFFRTYDAHQDAILAYFDERKTSGPVEGINNKARVITKRCYGVKKTKTLWNRLCLDLNLAARAIGRTVAQMADLTRLIRNKFLRYYT
jgi:transposase